MERSTRSVEPVALQLVRTKMKYLFAHFNVFKVNQLNITMMVAKRCWPKSQTERKRERERERGRVRERGTGWREEERKGEREAQLNLTPDFCAQDVSVLLELLNLVMNVLLLRSAHPLTPQLQKNSVPRARSTRTVEQPVLLLVITKMTSSTASQCVYQVCRNCAAIVVVVAIYT